MSFLTSSAVPLGAQGLGTTPQPGQALRSTTVHIDEDGGVTISREPDPEEKQRHEANFYDNIADEIGDTALGVIAAEILDGIEADLTSRAKFITNLTAAMELLGLEIEDATNTKTQKRNVSRVRHPVLLEAVVKSQSQARGEMLPTDGPAKVKTRGAGSNAQQDMMATALQADLNNYLTTIAREYYPDMDRGLFSLFFSGNLFRKVYEHPIKGRPVVDSIMVEDLIVSEDATDLDSAIRVTHRSRMPPGKLRRMQILGGWRDVPIGTPMPTSDPAKKKEQVISGVSPTSVRPQDLTHEIYETTTDLDLSEWQYEESGKPEGLEVPYVVVLEKDSRQVLSVTRGWRKDDPEYQRRQRFVHYGMVPSFGFLCLGYAHLLGNQTKALTAIWRILCDAGMFSNFPGGVKTKGVRTDTNEIQPGPGEFQDVDIGGADDIRKALMPMPYQGPSPVFIQLSEIIGQDAQRLAGAPEIETGEGRTNAPVGTIMAQIEQQTQTMSAVHKRLHTAQARELELLMECFAENPEALWKLSKDPKRRWALAQEFSNLDVTPASDPNTPSNIHRIMVNTAIVTLASTNPDIYDKYATHKRALLQIGVSDVDSFLHPAQQGPGGPPPEAIIAQAEVQGKQIELEGKKIDLQAKTADAQTTAQSRQLDAQTDAQETQRKAANDEVVAAQKNKELAADAQSEALDRQSQEKIEQTRLAVEMARLHATEMQAQRKDALQGLGAAADHHATMSGIAATHHAAMAGLGVQRETAAQTAKTAKETAAVKAKTAAAKPKAKPKAKK